MKPIRALALIALLLCLTLSLCLVSCQNEKPPQEIDSDTVATDTMTTEPDESIPTNTMPDETPPLTRILPRLSLRTPLPFPTISTSPTPRSAWTTLPRMA